MTRSRLDSTMCFAGHERPPPLTHSLLTATLEGMMAEAWSASGLGAQSLSRTGSINGDSANDIPCSGAFDHPPCGFPQRWSASLSC